MLDLKKLENMLDAALEREDADSLNAWLDEEESKDRASGIFVLDQVESITCEKFDIEFIQYDNPYTVISETSSVANNNNAMVLAA